MKNILKRFLIFSFVFSAISIGNAAIKDQNGNQVNASGPLTTFTGLNVNGAPCVGAPIDASYKLAFDDEFNGSSLDLTKWATGWFGTGITPGVNSVELECYDPAQVTISGGLLHLTAISKTETCGSSKPYASGLISSNGLVQFTFGYFEARINLPPSGSQIANWPAFWTDGQNWPVTGEMDIMEGLNGQACSHFHSPSGGPGACASGNFSGWHIFAAKWVSGQVTYYYDNILVNTIDSGITSAPMYLILNNAMSNLNDFGGPTVAPADMQVDWVHVYSTTLSAVTPQANYTGPGGCM